MAMHHKFAVAVATLVAGSAVAVPAAMSLTGGRHITLHPAPVLSVRAADAAFDTEAVEAPEAPEAPEAEPAAPAAETEVANEDANENEAPEAPENAEATENGVE